VVRGLGTSHRVTQQAGLGGQLRAGCRIAVAFSCAATLAATCAATLALGVALSGSAAFAQSATAPLGPTEPSFPRASSGVLGGPVQAIDAKQPLFLQGDELIYDTKGNKVVARGNVEIFYNNYVLKADEVTYDQAASTLSAVGNVELKEPNGNIIRAERYTLTDDFKDGFAQALSVQGRDNTRIAAERVVRRDGNISEFQNGKFSPCKSDPGKPPLWCISAARIIHDQANGNISYQDAYFEMFGQKILYLPFFQHPDPSVKRRSGFLVPEFSTSSTFGFAAELPYHFALAPNYDLTIHPLFTAKLGVLWKGDWRHRVSFGDVVGEYTVKVAAIDESGFNNRVVGSNLDPWRGSIETKGKFSLSSWWKFGWDVTVESDDTFRRKYKLDNILQSDRINSVYLQGLGERSHFSMTGYQFGGLLLSDTSVANTRVMPVVDWNYVMANSVLGGELSWNVNALSLKRADALGAASALKADGTRLTGVRSIDSDMNRASVDVNWRRKLTDQIGITYTPFVNVRGDVSQLANTPDPSQTTATTLLTTARAPLLDETQTRGVVSAGILASYPWIASGPNASHIIEPIGQLIGRSAKTSQQRLPDEDARSLVFDETNLFELSKFSGYDRVETGTRANYGLQYTFQSNSGGSARALVGQSRHISGENAYAMPGLDIDGKRLYNPNSGLETGRSDYVLGLYVAPSTIFRAIGQARFDETSLALRRADLMTQINYGPISATALYGFTSADPLTSNAVNQQQVIGNLAIKLTDRWSVMAAAVYDIDERFRIQDVFQVKYTDDCFALTTTYTETFINNPARDLAPDRSIMFRFEFKYLGDFRYTTNSLEIPGVANQTTAR
jgi:LPS-assembly protein